MKKFYITTAIDYVNSLPHIGTAYEKITADCIARAKRLLGYDVRFCMGTDEHSANVRKKAVEQGLDPLAYCDMMAPMFLKIWEKLSISNDDFIRTTEERHKKGVASIFLKIKDAGDIYKAVYKGLYCEGCEAFIQEKELVDGHCPNHMKPPMVIEEENYFFRLSKYTTPLLEHIKANPGFILPETRRNEIVRLLESGLEDISVSRSGLEWGIPLPEDSSHMVYVWFDALINYISALGFGGEDETLVEKYWPCDLHVIGKDITRFHCVIWPAMLMSAGIELPVSVFGHGFIYHRGEKMSKSLGNVVSPLDVVDNYGPDPLRFFLLKEVVYGQDGDFTFDRFIERYNSDLANDLGNLMSRTLSMVGRYLGGVIPSDTVLPENSLSGTWGDTVSKWTGKMEEYDLSGACETVWELVRASNRRIEESAPWNLAKDPSKKKELEALLFDMSTVMGGIALLLSPYIPLSAQKIWDSLGQEGELSGFKLDRTKIPYAPRGKKLEKPIPLFPRIEENKVEKEVKEKTPVEAPAEEENYVSIEDFAKLDIRVGTVKKASNVKGSDKLLKLEVDDGDCGRTIIAGIAENYSPKYIEGKQIVFVANLKPRKIMGEMSQGMVLAAGSEDSTAILTPIIEIAPGSKVG